jgi:DNA-binding GntR family transcriptional regulator
VQFGSFRPIKALDGRANRARGKQVAAAVDRAYDTIRLGIQSGTYPPGTHIRAAEVAGQLGISRTPVREAMRRLHAEGVVDFVANHGAYVIEWSRADIAEVFDLRCMLESYAVERAAQQITAERCVELGLLATQMSELAAEQTPEFLERIAELNDRFHRAILATAGGRRLTALVAAVVDMPIVLGTFHRYNEEDLRRSMAHHHEIVAALELRDGEWAASVMRSHILAARRIYFASSVAVGLDDQAAE